MKRFISLFISLTLMLTYFAATETVAAAEYEMPKLTENQCFAYLGKNSKLSGFKSVEPGDDPTQIKYTERGGEEYYTLDVSNGTKSLQLNFDISDNFANCVSDGSVFEIEVEYYNDTQGYFQLHYDSIEQADLMSEIAVTDDSKSWSTAKFVIDDAYFGNRLLDKYDFQLRADTNHSSRMPISPASIVIRSVKITRYPAANPVRYKGWVDESGNTYEFYRDDKIFKNEFTNLSDRVVDANVTYRAVDCDGVERWRMTENVKLEPGEAKQTEANVEIDFCQIYDIHTDIIDKANGIEEHFSDLKVGIIKTDPDGIQNDHHYYNAHTGNWSDGAEKEEGFDMLRKSNTYGIRWQMGWYECEPSEGNYVIQDKFADDMEYMAKYGIHAMWLMYACPSFHTGGWSWIPRGEKALDAWDKALRWMVTEVKTRSDGMINTFEYWNEPNIRLFNGGGGVGTSTDVEVQPEEYTPAAKVTYNVIKELWPEMKVGVLSICDVTAQNSFNWLTRSMSVGLADYCDAVTLHPYGIADRVGMAAAVKKYDDHVKNTYGKDPEIWNTEVGFTTVDDNIKTEKTMMDYNVRSYLYYLGEGVGEKYVTYNMDGKGEIPFDREDWFGHTSAPTIAEDHNEKAFVPRPVLVAETAMNYLTAMTNPDGKGDYHPDEDVFVYRLNSEKFNSNVLTVWSKGGPKMCTLNLGQKEVTVSDEYGNMYTVTSDDGLYSFLVGETPFYVLGDFKNLVIEDNHKISLPESEIIAVTGDAAKFSVECGIDGAELEVIVPDEVEIDGTPQFKDGKATVLLKLGMGITENFPVSVRIKKDGNIIGIAQCDVTVKNVKADTRINVELRNMEDMNKWNGTAYITNYSETEVATGKLSILEPNLLSSVKSIDIGRIPCGKTSEVNFNFPDITKKGIYNIVYRIDLSSGESYESKSRVDFAVTKYSESEKKIDGIIEEGEWDFSSWMYAEGIENVNLMGNVPYRGKDDCSARLTTAWDEENFYLAAEVTDDIHFNNTPHSNSYQCDDIQFALYHDKDAYLAAGQAGERFNEFGISLNNEGPGIWRWKNQTDDVPIGEVVGEGIEYDVKRGDKITYYELKLPWKVIFGYDFNPNDEDYVGFSYVVNDNDGAGRNLSIEYAGGIVNGKNSAKFSKLQFVKKDK